MSYRNWIAAVAFGLAITFAVSPIYCQESEEQDGQGQAHSDYTPPRRIPFVVPVDVIEDQAAADARQRREERAEQRELNDLAAQQGMDEATRKMADYAIYQTILITIGTVLLFVTLGLTYMANRAAQEAVAVTRNIGEAQIRAYLSVGPVKGGTEGQDSVIRLKNSGQSPARNVRHIAATSNLMWPIKREPELIIPMDDQIVPSFMMSPGAEIEIDAVWLNRRDELIGNNTCSYGIIYYEDVFGAKYELHFLARWRVMYFLGGSKFGTKYGWEPAPFHNEETKENS